MLRTPAWRTFGLSDGELSGSYAVLVSSAGSGRARTDRQTSFASYANDIRFLVCLREHARMMPVLPGVQFPHSSLPA